MNLFAKLKGIELTDNEISILEFIEKHPMDFVKMTTEEILFRTYVSRSTLYRLCKKLNYDGVTELKLMIAISIADTLMHESFNVDYNYPFSRHSSEFEVIANVRKLYEHAVYISSNIIEVSELHRVSKEIVNAKEVVIFLDDVYYPLALGFKEKMMTLGIRVEVPRTLREVISMSNNTSESTFGIVISYASLSKHNFDIIKSLKGNRSKFLLISQMRDEKFNQMGSYNMYIASTEHVHDKISTYTSSVSISYILDCLFSNVLRMNYEENVEKIRELLVKSQSS